MEYRKHYSADQLEMLWGQISSELNAKPEFFEALDVIDFIVQDIIDRESR